MEPITVTIDGAKALSGLGKTKIYEKIGNGQLEVIRVGRRTLVKVASLRQMLEAA